MLDLRITLNNGVSFMSPTWLASVPMHDLLLTIHRVWENVKTIEIMAYRP